VVNKDATTTTLNTSAASTVVGQSVTFTATGDAWRRGGSPAVPSRSWTARPSWHRTTQRGVATFSTSTLSKGSHTIKAVYGRRH